MGETIPLVAGLVILIAALGAVYYITNLDQTYYCEDRNIVSMCFKLSAVSNGISSRCYYNESAPNKYFTCSSGWKPIKDFPGIMNNLTIEGNQTNEVGLSDLIVNGIILNDSTVNNLTSNTCSATRYGFKVEVNPCTITSPISKNLVQYVNFTNTLPTPINTSWVFVYESKDGLSDGKVETLSYVNTSYTEQETRNAWATNYLVTDVVNTTALNISNSSLYCSVGNKNNTFMYAVTRGNSTNNTISNYCFSQFSQINSTAFYLNGSYDTLIDVTKYHLVDTYTDVTSAFKYLGYCLNDSTHQCWEVNSQVFQGKQSLYTKWTYSSISKSGKWSIFGYEASTPILTAIKNDAYLLLDPAWSVSDCLGIGGNITIDGDYCVHTFTSNGFFNATNPLVNGSVLVVAGGGGGGARYGGGGGAGGLIFNNTLNLTSGVNGTIVIVGNGGDGGIGVVTSGNGIGISGLNSSFGTYKAQGGGGGGTNSVANGLFGGSGGGGSGSGGAGAGGLSYPLQGKPGGRNQPSAPQYGSGGGGGYSTVGKNGTSSTAGDGGEGYWSTISGTNLSYSAGGGGATYESAGTQGIGGSGCGANASSGLNNAYQVSRNYSGCGGGGASTIYPTPQNGSSGASGVVIVRYLAGGLNSLTLTTNSPTTNQQNNPVVFNATVTPAGYFVSNITFFVWNSTGSLITSQTNSLANTNETTTSIHSYSFTPNRRYLNLKWNAFAQDNTTVTSWGTNRTFNFTAPLTGKVLTSAGAVINGASVFIYNITGNLIGNTTSNASGDWVFAYTEQVINFTAVGYNSANISQGGNAYPFINE